MSCAIAGGMLCAKPFHPMWPESMPMASAFSATVLLVGAFPCTGNRFPSQQGVRTGRPKGSSLNHRRLGPKQHRCRSAAPPSDSSLSTCTGKEVQNLRPRSTGKPNMGPRKTVISSSIRPGSAPRTFSSQNGRPVPLSSWAASGIPGTDEAVLSSASTVEYGWHGGLAPMPTARTRSNSADSSAGRYASATLKCSRPKRRA